MPDDPRLCAVVRLLHEHVGSPLLRHIRQPAALRKLALEILLREERNVANRARIEAQRVARLNRLMSGADCPWTQADATKTWHSRRNGRLCCLVQAEGNRWVLSRVATVGDKRGVEVGRYESHAAASKAVGTVAYQPDLV